MTSLPVPCSPVTSTLASLGPTRSRSRSTGCIAGELAKSRGAPPRSRVFSSSRRRLLRSALPSPARVPRALGPERRDEPRVVPRLLYVVARTPPHCLDCALDAAPGGHDEDGKLRV